MFFKVHTQLLLFLVFENTKLTFSFTALYLTVTYKFCSTSLFSRKDFFSVGHYGIFITKCCITVLMIYHYFKY